MFSGFQFIRKRSEKIKGMHQGFNSIVSVTL